MNLKRKHITRFELKKLSTTLEFFNWNTEIPQPVHDILFPDGTDAYHFIPFGKVSLQHGMRDGMVPPYNVGLHISCELSYKLVGTKKIWLVQIVVVAVASKVFYDIPFQW